MVYIIMVRKLFDKFKLGFYVNIQHYIYKTLN